MDHTAYDQQDSEREDSARLREQWFLREQVHYAWTMIQNLAPKVEAAAHEADEVIGQHTMSLRALQAAERDLPLVKAMCDETLAECRKLKEVYSIAKEAFSITKRGRQRKNPDTTSYHSARSHRQHTKGAWQSLCEVLGAQTESLAAATLEVPQLTFNSSELNLKLLCVAARLKPLQEELNSWEINFELGLNAICTFNVNQGINLFLLVLHPRV